MTNRSTGRLARSWLLRGGYAALALFAAQSASAQGGDSGPQAAGGAPSLENVVVTARRQSENLQQTPIAVSAFTESDLKAQTAVGLLDLQYQTPGLVAQPSQTAWGTINYQIRGQFQVASLAVLDPPIGLYQDGVYMGSHVGSGLANLLDVERVEILKGPQGTLYGRNTTGGAIGVYTKMPVYDFESEATVGVGNDERYSVDGVVNLPLIKDTAALRVVASRSTDGGYGSNKVTGDDLSDSDDTYLRATLRVNTSDSFEMVLRGDFSRRVSNGPVISPPYIQPASGPLIWYGIVAGTPPTFLSPGVINPASLPANFAAGQAFYDSFKAAPVYPYDVSLDRQRPAGAKVYGGSLTLEKDFGSMTLKSITSLRRVQTNHPQDFDGTPIPAFSSWENYGASHRIYTQELQLTGLTLNERLKYVLGVFYLDSEAFDRGESFGLPGLSGVIGWQDTKVETESPAAFGQATYDITPTVHFTGGLRWTREERITTLVDFDTVYPTNVFKACTTPLIPVNQAECVEPYGVKEENISYLAGLDWNFTDDVLLYVRTARGFKSGGVNERVTSDPATVSPFQSEVVTDYEIGVKSEFFSNRLRLNAALFRSDYDDLQRALFKLIGGAPVNVVQNAGKATIDGLELEGQALPLENLSIRASAAWVEPTYDEYTYDEYKDGLGTDLSGTKFPLVSPLGAPQDLLTQKGYGLLNG